MFKHNIIDLFKTFSMDEVKNFERFLNSPYFNSSKKMIKLYKEIIKYYPDFNNTDLTKENLMKKTSIQSGLQESTLRDALSELLKHAFRFISISSFEKNKEDTDILLLNELKNRKTDRIFQKRVKLFEENYKDNTIDSKHIYNKYLFKTAMFNYEITYEKILHKNIAQDKVEKITSLSFDLIKFFLSEFISLQLNSMILSDKYNIELKNNPMKIINERININNLKHLYPDEDSMIIYLYKYLLETFENIEDTSKYFTYKKFIEINKSKLSLDEITFHYHWLVNYCILKKNSANSEIDFNTELFEIYNTILSNKYYKDRKINNLSVDLYRDILIHGIQLKKYNWVIKFIQNFQPEVSVHERENILNYSYTYFYCSIGDYLKALDYYNRIVMDKFVFKYDIKNIVLKMYYELDYIEETICEIKSYREFLRNNEMVTFNRKIRLGNFLKYLDKLISFKFKYNKENIEYFLNILKMENNLSFKDWLIDKTNELIVKNN